MAATPSSSGGCALERSLNRLTAASPRSLRAKSQAEPLYVIALERYGRDPDFAVHFPDSISMSDSLFDATVTDGDCRVRVSLDPRLNKLIHNNTLRCGSVVRNVVFSTGHGGEGENRTFHICSLDVETSAGGDAALRALSNVDVTGLPWLRPEPKLLPLRARRSCYLAMWNNRDFTGDMWRETPSSQSGEESGDEVVEDPQPVVSLAELRRRFLKGSRRPRGALCVRILHKSRLMYYGKAEQICECPFKAELQVGDGSSSACVVLWNTVCLDWYRCLQPGQVLRLSRYRVKESYGSRSGQNTEPNIELSLNSRNPTAKITVVPKQEVSTEWNLPDLPHNFVSVHELRSIPPSTVCDVVGVVVFVGRPERVRSKDGRQSELEEYRWLQLEDGTSDQPITVKLFSTSQPDIQNRILPMALVVCTRLKLIKNTVNSATTFEYLTNTPPTQVYCTGTGPRPVMPYRGLRPVRHFLQWLKQVDEASILDRAVMGGYFSYPPLPVSLPSFMDNRQGEAGMISGGEMKLQCERLHYRERRRFVIQCTITEASYHSREDSGRMRSDPPSAQLSPRVPRQREGSEIYKTPVKRKLLFNPPTPSSRRRLAPPLQQDSAEDDAENDWDPQMPSGRMSGSLSMETKSRSEGLLGASPSDIRQRTGMSSSWGPSSNMGTASKMASFSMTPKVRSRVVVVKYERKPVLSNLFALTTMFGTVREHLVLKNKAFLEFHTHEEALEMANYYKKKPAVLHGKEVHVYLSKELIVIAKDRPERDSRIVKSGVSPVVFFSNLPRETEKKAELLVIARRFGTVVKHLFLNDEAFVQMSNTEDAEMLVKYYTIHSLTLGRRPIQLNICTKYKTLTVPPGKGDQVEVRGDSGRKSSSSKTSYKSSSQRSSSSRARESSSERSEKSKPTTKKSDGLAEHSDDEGEGVLVAHDDDDEEQEEEAYDEETAAEETNPALEREDDEEQDEEEEESVTEQTDLEETMEYKEDSATEPTENGAREAKNAELTEEVEAEQEERAEPDADHEHDVSNEEHKDTESHGHMEEDENAPEDFGEKEGPGECDFPENMDEFVTLDELAEEEDAERQDSKSMHKGSAGRAKESGGLRVVNVVGFKRGYGYLEEILALAKPFGKVVRHLVLDVRPEAFLELTEEHEARAMVRFYNGNVIPSVCGKSVKVYHSQTYSTIQVQSGKVVYIAGVPPLKVSEEASFLKIAEPFGKVKRYYYNKPRNECFIEMDKGEEAERFVKISQENPPKFQGKRLMVLISRKYKQLRHGHRPPSPVPEEKRAPKREHSEENVETPSSSSAKNEDEPPVKKVKDEKPSTDKEESSSKKVKHEEKEKQDAASDGELELKKEDTEEQSTETTEAQNTEIKAKADDDDATAAVDAASTSCVSEPEKTQETDKAPVMPTQPVKKPQTTLDTLGSYEPNTPVGVEFVKMGYYCRVCFLFYSNEDTAKKVHCSSQAHYDKLKKHLEKEQAKAQSREVKK